MDVLKTKPRSATSKLVLILAVGAGIWITLVITTAIGLADKTGSASGQLGPIHLFELTRTPVSGGYQASMRLIPAGVMQYCCLLLLLWLAAMRLRKPR